MNRLFIVVIIIISSLVFGCSETPWNEMSSIEKARVILKKTPEEQKNILCSMSLLEFDEIASAMSKADAEKLFVIGLDCPSKHRQPKQPVFGELNEVKTKF